MCVNPLYHKSICRTHRAHPNTEMRTEHVCHYYYHLCLYDFLALLSHNVKQLALHHFLYLILGRIFSSSFLFFSVSDCLFFSTSSVARHVSDRAGDFFFYYFFFYFFTNFSNVEKRIFMIFVSLFFFSQFASSLMHNVVLVLKLLHSTADNFNHAHVK